MYWFSGEVWVLFFLQEEQRKRFALPNSEVMIHQPSGGAKGHTDIKIVADNILKIRKKINEILARKYGKPIEVIEVDTERDFYMSAEEAKEYGIIDELWLVDKCKSNCT